MVNGEIKAAMKFFACLFKVVNEPFDLIVSPMMPHPIKAIIYLYLILCHVYKFPTWGTITQKHDIF